MFGFPKIPANNVGTVAVSVTDTALGTVTLPLDTVQGMPQPDTVVRHRGVTVGVPMVTPE